MCAPNAGPPGRGVRTHHARGIMSCSSCYRVRACIPVMAASPMAALDSDTCTGTTNSAGPSTSISGYDTEHESSSSARPNLLSKLRCPRTSELTRKRKVVRNYPPGKRRSSTSSVRGASDPKSVTPSQRVTEFPNENLSVSNGKLFCLACREEIALKRSVVSYHIKSAKHLEGKEKVFETGCEGT